MSPGHSLAQFGRYRRIAEVLGRHGLAYLAGLAGLGHFFAGHPQVAEHPTLAEHTPPEHLRMALEELGATFVKLGQILSTRPDLLPADYETELAKLRDHALPVPVEAIRAVIVAELGRPVEELFASFEDAPLAAASIGQAHAATLPDGTEVVVKVRRPGVVEQVAEDLEILQNLAATVARRWDLAERYDPVGLAQEFARTLRAELDYLAEGRNAERFAANFAADPAIQIPRIFWEVTTSRVLVLERIRGLKIDDLAGLDAAGIDRPALALRASALVLKMVFDDGFFHADPHPGNFFIGPGGRIGLIDFGMVGALDDDLRANLGHLLLALTDQDPDRLVDAFLDLGVASGTIDRPALRRDVGGLVARYYGRPLAELALGPLIGEVFAIIRQHRLHLPPDLLVLLKTLVMLEGVGLQLDPTFRLTTAVVPYARRLMLRQYAPGPWLRRLGRAGLDAAELGLALPRQLQRLLAQLERGTLGVSVRPVEVEPLLHRAERMVNRLVLGVLAAAFIVGLAVLLAAYRPTGDGRWVGGFFAVGFVVALALGVYLAWGILRSGGD